MPYQLGKKADDFLKDLWENRAVGLPTESLDNLSPTALAYLRECYPYLQMISSKAIIEDKIIPKFKTTPGGWVIHDYGQAMSTSPGKLMYGPGNPELEDGGKGGSGGTGDGTLVRQSFDAAAAMVELAIEKGWPGIEIIAGTSTMQWAAWMAAQDKNFLLVGYQPDQEAKEKRERIVKLRSQRGQAPQAEVETAPTKGIND